MRRSFAVTALLVAFPFSLDAQQVERRTLSGSRFAIYNLAGELTATAASGRDVTIEITRSGADGSKLAIETGEIGDRQTLRVIYPDDEIVYRPFGRGRGRTELMVRDDGTFGSGRDRGRARRVRISGSGSGLDAAADLRVGIPEGAVIALHLAVGRVNVRNVNGDILVDVGSADVTTEGTRGKLDLDTGSGEVRVTDASGDVTLDSGSGGATLSRIRGRKLFVDSGSGEIDGSDITVEELVLDSGSGSVSMQGVTARDVTLDTGSGSVELDLLSDVESMLIDSGSGSVTLRVPRTLGAEIEVDSGSGGIDVDLQIQVKKWRKSYLLGTIGDGKGRIRGSIPARDRYGSPASRRVVEKRGPARCRPPRRFRETRCAYVIADRGYVSRRIGHSGIARHLRAVRASSSLHARWP